MSPVANDWLGLARPALAVALLVSALLRARTLRQGESAPTAFARDPQRSARTFWMAATGFEVTAGAALVVLDRRLAAVFAAAFFLMAALHIEVAIRRGLEAPCGCLGFSTHAATRIVVFRALVLSGIAISTAAVDASLREIAGDPRDWLGTGVLAATVIALSPDLRSSLATRARTRIARTCEREPRDDASLARRVRRTSAWSTLQDYLNNNDMPSDVWSEGCTRYLSFGARYRDNVATAVFAVHFGFGRPACSPRVHRGLTGPIVLATGSERLPWSLAESTSKLAALVHPSRRHEASFPS